MWDAEGALNGVVHESRPPGRRGGVFSDETDA
jgi:hypothetical protein